MARDPSLVRPGNPDGSPAYTAMLRRLGGRGTKDDRAPTPDELAIVRAWIESLPPSAGICGDVTPITRRHVEPLVRRQARVLGKPINALRVLSLAHLDAGCASAEQLTRWRTTIGLFLTALAGKPKPVPTYPLDPHGRLLAVDIHALGWDGEHWRALTGAGPRAAGSIEPLIVRADWIMAHVLRGELGVRLVNPFEPTPPKAEPDVYEPMIRPNDREIAQTMFASVAAPDVSARNVEVMLQLVRAHLAPAGLSRVAAELGVDRATLEGHVANSAGGVKDLLLRLTYGTIPRAEIEENWLLLGRLVGATPPARTSAPAPFDVARPSITPETPVDIVLYADRVRYASGDPIRLIIRANLVCHLTVVSIDASGHGTVIFPNDFAPNNLTDAQLNLELPAADAGYRFRVGGNGRERIVALCARTPGTVDGIQHDFERQRFQELGPYSAFLDAAIRRKASVSDDRSEQGTPQVVAPDQVWRTGIVIEVE